MTATSTPQPDVEPAERDAASGGAGGAGAAHEHHEGFVRGQDTYPSLSTWRQYVLARAGELHVWAHFLEARALAHADARQGDLDRPTVEVLARAATDHLEEARAAALGAPRRRIADVVSGASIERAMANMNAAEVQVARFAPLDELTGWLPDIIARIERYLTPSDPRRVAAEAVADGARAGRPLEDHDRRVLAWALHGAASTSEQQHSRVRSFRNIVLLSAAIMLVIAVALAALGLARPDVLPLCFQPGDAVVCATGERPFAPGDDLLDAYADLAGPWDILLVQAVGLVAAALAGALSLHQIRGTSTPFSVPVAIALLKLPCGALTALLGILLMRGEFIPGLSALDSSGQIIAWAIVFGYAQQVFTHLVDRQAQTVLNAVGTPDPPTPRAAAAS